MELLSSKLTFFMKWVVPVVWTVGIAVFVGIALATHAWGKDPAMLMTPVIMLLAGTIMYKVLIWNLADEVRDGGNVLIVRKRSIEERVPLSEIINIGITQFTNPQRLTLRLRTPGKFGDEIVFMPKQSLIRIRPFARNKIAELLIKRVDAARLGAAR